MKKQDLYWKSSNRPCSSHWTKKVVQVIKLITKGTIEEKIITIQNQKLAIINSVFDGNNDTQLINNFIITIDYNQN